MGGPDGEIGNLLAGDQHVADLEPVDVVARVHAQQILAGHVVVLGNDGPAVPGLHGVGLLSGLDAVEQQGHVRKVGKILYGQIALADLPVLHEINGDGVLVAVGGGYLGHQLVQSALRLGGADELAVDIQGVAVFHHTQGLAEGLLKVGFLHQGAAVGHAGGVGQTLRRQAVAAAQLLRDGGLHPLHGGQGLLLAGYGAQLHALKGESGAGGVEDPVGGEDGQQEACRKKDRRLQKAVAGHAALPGLDPEGQGGEKGTNAVGGSAGLLPQEGHTARQEKLELPGGAAGLREPAVDAVRGSPAHGRGLGSGVSCSGGFCGSVLFLRLFFHILLDHLENPPIVTKQCQGLQNSYSPYFNVFFLIRQALIPLGEEEFWGAGVQFRGHPK